MARKLSDVELERILELCIQNHANRAVSLSDLGAAMRMQLQMNFIQANGDGKRLVEFLLARPNRFHVPNNRREPVMLAQDVHFASSSMPAVPVSTRTTEMGSAPAIETAVQPVSSRSSSNAGGVEAAESFIEQVMASPAGVGVPSKMLRAALACLSKESRKAGKLHVKRDPRVMKIGKMFHAITDSVHNSALTTSFLPAVTTTNMTEAPMPKLTLQPSTSSSAEVAVVPGATGVVDLQWVVDEAEIYVQRALRRPVGARGVHVMEIKAKSLKHPESKVYMKQVVTKLRQDPRIAVVKDVNGAEIFSAAPGYEQSGTPIIKPLPSAGVEAVTKDTNSLAIAVARPLSRSHFSVRISGRAPVEVQTTDALEHLPTYRDQLPNTTDYAWNGTSSYDKQMQREIGDEKYEDGESEGEDLEEHLSVLPTSAVSDGSASFPASYPPLARSAGDDELRRIFFPSGPTMQTLAQCSCSLGDLDSSAAFSEAGLLGRLSGTACSVWLNTHEPFCLVTVGVQGSGKSHTMGVVLENCLLPCPKPASAELVRLERPMTALVLHYDQNVSSICEATGLVSPVPIIARLLEADASPALKNSCLTVLVSPSYYLQRRKFYGDHCTVKPLLFRWHTLSADHIKKLMRIKDTDQQLYVASMLALLRKYQRDGKVPDFPGFMLQLRQVCTVPGQANPLQQRIALLESLIYESDTNVQLRTISADVCSSLSPGRLIVADLTDPLLASDEANGIFQVMTEQFRTTPTGGCGKLLALDEAHKFMDGVSSDGLSNAIVDAARLMRHDGMRVVVSTQSPKVLAPELLELVSVAVLHRFHSRDWFSYLQSKVPIGDEIFHQLMLLPAGDAIAFAARHSVQQQEHVMPITIRPRITADRRVSRTNL